MVRDAEGRAAGFVKEENLSRERREFYEWV